MGTHRQNLFYTLSHSQAEMSALENSGRLPASAYQGATMYTTLSPCDMCTGACILYKVARVVIGENKTFLGGESHLQTKGIEVIVLDNTECKALMKKFIQEKPQIWCSAEFNARFLTITDAQAGTKT
jgi:cytosine/creatinine deaminase